MSARGDRLLGRDLLSLEIAKLPLIEDTFPIALLLLKELNGDLSRKRLRPWIDQRTQRTLKCPTPPPHDPRERTSPPRQGLLMLDKNLEMGPPRLKEGLLWKDYLCLLREFLYSRMELQIQRVEDSKKYRFSTWRRTLICLLLEEVTKLLPRKPPRTRTGTSATQGGITDRSPIRTLSEDRVHVSLRLGPVFESYSDPRAAEQEISLTEDIPLLARTTDKGKASLPAGTRKRVARSTTQGISLKKGE